MSYNFYTRSACSNPYTCTCTSTHPTIWIVQWRILKNNIGQQTSLGNAVCVTQASNMSTVNHLEGSTTILLHRIYCYMGVERMNHFFLNTGMNMSL